MDSSDRLKPAPGFSKTAAARYRLDRSFFVLASEIRPQGGARSFVLREGGVNQNQRNGSALLEFALALPVLLFILLGIMEFASVFFVRHAILHAAREASRSYAIGESTQEEAEALALAQLSAVQADFAASASPQSDSSVERWVEVSLPISQAALGDPLNVLGDSDLTVRVTMRREEE